MARQKDRTDILFSLGSMQGPTDAEEILSGLESIEEAAQLEVGLGNLSNYTESIGDDDGYEALGAVQTLRAALLHPLIGKTRRETQARAYAQLQRMNAVLNASTALQTQDAQRPTVFILARFNHAAAGPKTITGLKPSLPGQTTQGAVNGPLRLIQARTFLRSGSWGDAEVDVSVARIPASQYVAPTGDPDPLGLPIEAWAPHAYRNGIQPPKIRGLDNADSNTVITINSNAFAPVNYAFMLEFVMESWLGGECRRILPSLTRGPLAITSNMMRMALRRLNV